MLEISPYDCPYLVFLSLFINQFKQPSSVKLGISGIYKFSIMIYLLFLVLGFFFELEKPGIGIKGFNFRYLIFLPDRIKAIK